MLPAPRPRSPRIVVTVIGALFVLAVGLWFGGHPSWLPSPLRSAFVSESATQKLENQVYGLLTKDYYRPLNRTTLVNQGLAAAVESLNDPYSHYYDPANYHTFTDTTTDPQDDGGIGVVVDGSTKAGLVIGEVYAKTPASRAGLEAGDVIVTADGHSFAGLSETQMTDYVRGQAGTSVTLTVQRPSAGKPAGRDHVSPIPDRAQGHLGAGHLQSTVGRPRHQGRVRRPDDVLPGRRRRGPRPGRQDARPAAPRR